MRTWWSGFSAGYFAAAGLLLAAGAPHAAAGFAGLGVACFVLASACARRDVMDFRVNVGGKEPASPEPPPDFGKCEACGYRIESPGHGCALCRESFQRNGYKTWPEYVAAFKGESPAKGGGR